MLVADVLLVSAELSVDLLTRFIAISDHGQNLLFIHLHTSRSLQVSLTLMYDLYQLLTPQRDIFQRNTSQLMHMHTHKHKNVEGGIKT